MSVDPTITLEYVTDGRPCWCRPEVLVPCPEGDHEARISSDANGDAHMVSEHAGYWRCAGRGLVSCDEPGCEDGAPCSQFGHIIVHRAI